MKTTSFSSLMAALPVVYGAIDAIIPPAAAPAAVVAPSGPAPTNVNHLIVTNTVDQGFGGIFGKKAEPTGVPALDLSALTNVTDVKQLDMRADKADKVSAATKASEYLPGQVNGGGYATQPIQFQPTGQTQLCYTQLNGGNNCQQIYYGYNTATTIVNGGFNQGVGGQGDPGVPLCNTYYNGGGIPTSSCSIVGAPFGNVGGIGGGCQTSYFGGVQTTNCIQGGALGGYGAPYLPCFTYFNGGQQSVTCTPTTTASTYFTTSTQSFCNTFVNGGATTTSCTTNFYTSATRTSYSIINAAAKETGMPGGVLGQGVAAVLGVAAMIAL
ncbi:hypothetical protein BLS_004561 [Venturia inaequalis]|uniref:Uncharacterized protein n=1 Tax=Venturia inaequalis TaxID=5025 RepID=A0A8H3Z8H6_VENIN|nr:hypothetical protein BLS_004561 [Venturia inaequalis]